jgi:hypothetical protein
MSLLEENAEVLQNLRNSGVRLDSPRQIDFEHVFEHRPDAQAFADVVARRGYSVTLRDVSTHHWEVTATITMTPTCAFITKIETELSELAKQHCGSPDGWGFLD